jgi:hypothetical protein
VQEDGTKPVNSALQWAFWLFWSFLALCLGMGVGAALVSVRQSQGTTAAVVTGMGMILGLRWLAQRFISKQGSNQGSNVRWGAIALKTGVLVGAANLAVAAILLMIAVWHLIWPDRALFGVGTGAEIGAISALLGGIITRVVLAHPLQH